MNLPTLLIPEAVLCHVEATDAADIIGRLASILHDKGIVHGSFCEAVLAREQTMPTGLLLDAVVNAALPHADIEHVIRPGVALATLAQPVLFHAMDDPDTTVPVSLVFLLALSEPHAQIEMLQALAGILQSRAAVEEIWAAATAADLLAAVMANAEPTTSVLSA